MNILNPEHIREWELYTMNSQGVNSIDLMENAATAVVNWIQGSLYSNNSFIIFCGKGNNGGDGLAIGRLLHQLNKKVVIYILEEGQKGTEPFQYQLQLIRSLPIDVHFYAAPHPIDYLGDDLVIIDALFGIGLNKPLAGLGKILVDEINASSLSTISIDIPSGMYANQSSQRNTFVSANDTLSFQCLKPAFLVQENKHGFGNVHILDIGLDRNFENTLIPHYQLINLNYLKSIFRKRNPFSHKGSHGHGLLIVGSRGMMGAAVLASTACLRAGIGKLTVNIPSSGLDILQIALPEAICKPSSEDNVTYDEKDYLEFSAIGIGPGIGLFKSHTDFFSKLIPHFKGGIVLDADALNYLSVHKEYLLQLPQNTILTPHPKELERLFGKVSNDFERIELIRQKATSLKIIILLKGKYTMIATPEGFLYVSPFGNEGLAKAGTGDVLTGIITSLLAQGYDAVYSALLGVYIHGKSAELSMKEQTVETLLASDLSKYFGEAFAMLY